MVIQPAYIASILEEIPAWSNFLFSKIASILLLIDISSLPSNTFSFSYSSAACEKGVSAIVPFKSVLIALSVESKDPARLFKWPAALALSLACSSNFLFNNSKLSTRRSAPAYSSVSLNFLNSTEVSAIPC